MKDEMEVSRLIQPDGLEPSGVWGKNVAQPQPQLPRQLAFVALFGPIALEQKGAMAYTKKPKLILALGVVPLYVQMQGYLQRL